VTLFEAGLLVCGGALAGVVNTLAGGGSLLTVPLLTFAGLPADIANGTNRVGILIQNAVASWGFWREGVPGFREAAPLVLPVVGGALVGAYGVSQLDAATFQRLFGFVMLLLLVPTLRGPKPGRSPRGPLSGPLRALIFFGIGLYGGAVQAGVGILLIYALSLGGSDLVRSNSVKVVVNSCFTLVVLPIFLLAGQVAWLPALVLGAGFALGGFVGPRLAVRRGERLIRGVLGAAVVALAGRMLGLY
jgi:uncharacterized membrane protein YfcA